MEQRTIPRWPEFVVPALTMIFGLQLIRALLPYLVFLLGSRLGLPPFAYGGVGLLLFATAFLISPLSRWLGERRLLHLAAGGVALLRLLVQVWQGDPLLDMALVVAGTVLFIFFWPLFIALTQTLNGQQLGVAVLLGLCLDTALHGMFQTYDFIWQAGALPLWLALGLCLFQAAALAKLTGQTPVLSPRRRETRLAALPWLAFGLFLFLELVVFQNQARLAALTGWSLPAVFAWILSSHLIGLTGAILWHPRLDSTVVLGLLLIVALWPIAGASPWLAALSLSLGQLAIALLLSLILRSLAASRPASDAPNSRPGHPLYGVGMLGLVILLFVFYIPFIVPMPYNPAWILPLAGLLLAGCGISAVVKTTLPPRERLPAAALLAGSWALLACPVLLFLSRPSPVLAPPLPAAQTVRIVDYNIQHGFGPSGQLDIEATARTILAQQPDVVTLQEVGRGWVTNGSLDVFNWLAQRLGLPYGYYHPAGDALWGQAVFSRYPILQVDAQPLPPANLPLKRGFTYVQLDIGQPEPLQVINIHLHHLPWDEHIRLTQIEAIRDFIATHPAAQLVMAGDFNATPDSPEIQPLYADGLRDVIIEAELKPGYTFTSDQPYKRLDYIWLSPDSTAIEALIPHSLASDHLGIAATVRVGP